LEYDLNDYFASINCDKLAWGCHNVRDEREEMYFLERDIITHIL
jgi:hypothetical protein